MAVKLHERRLRATSLRLPRRSHDDVPPAELPAYLCPIDVDRAVAIAPDLETARQAAHPDHTVETHTRFAAAS
jgi:hypothetical protein